LHPNVLLLMGVCIDRKAQSDQLKLIMVTELMARGDFPAPFLIWAENFAH